jgi:hypothetical protein
MDCHIIDEDDKLTKIIGKMPHSIGTWAMHGNLWRLV